MSHVFVIAEAGISHDGDLRKALDLIDAAKEAKADAVKFQTFNAEKLAWRRPRPATIVSRDAYASLLRDYEMPLAWLPILKDHCDKAGIEFMTTCFDEETLRIVKSFVKRFKISHIESRDEAFVNAHLEYGKEVITSHTEEPKFKMKTKKLYCTSDYPTHLEAVKLGNLLQYERYDGFSDHTKNMWMGAMAVAAGARIVEVHFRLMTTEDGNHDRCVSHDPIELKRYIELLRQAQLAVYGAASEEPKKLERPGSAPRTSHPQASEETGPSDGPQGAAS